MADTKTQFVTKSGLKKRGWTENLIRQFLPLPDKTKTNPHRRLGPPMQLYLVATVEMLEASEDFAVCTATCVNRKLAARKGVETRRAKLEEYVSTLNIRVPQLAEDLLLRQACDHYNAMQEDRGKVGYCDVGRASIAGTDKSFQHRICVNFLRHQLTEYEEHLLSIAGKVGCESAYVELKTKVLEAISDTYPWLANECLRQEKESWEEFALSHLNDCA